VGPHLGLKMHDVMARQSAGKRTWNSQMIMYAKKNAYQDSYNQKRGKK